MAASQFAHAKTGGPVGPRGAPGRFAMAHSGTRQARQSVTQGVGLTTSRQDCGTSTVNSDLWGARSVKGVASCSSPFRFRPSAGRCSRDR